MEDTADRTSSVDGLLGHPLVLVVVSALWGFTNPLLKRNSEGLEDIRESGRLRQLAAEIKFLATNCRYVAAFVTNQLGSVLYFVALGAADLSLASPITSALTFLFTHICGVLLGEPIGNKALTYSGVVCVILGVSLCMLDKRL
ncbi:transmembrane protein 234-like [Pollicipes pollicipes]|uniref:transmembrane protein 234-like n=1 Tax=Pollicipes pollicipes TaxID=41117 RepID=UPI0018854FCD|nr:transmembrane protein 234-like [Pollicipes pollicipes]